MTRTWLCLLLVAACGDPGGDANEGEVITTVTLTFTPMSGGSAVTAVFDDPDGDGGDPPTIDPVTLAAGMFALEVGFQNRLEDPPEEITDEVRDEGDEHQLFFTGTAIEGPFVHAYADTDGAGLPIGLSSTITARTGTGQLTVTLKHLPPLDGNRLKKPDLAAMVASAGINSVGGDTDVSVTFSVTVP